MIRLQKILFPTDFSPCADRAFDLALMLAQQFGADLHMFHAVVLHEEDPHNPAHHFPDPEAIHNRLEKLADSEMARLVEREGATEARIQQVKSRGIAAAPTIMEHAEEWGADLIVMGTEGRRGPSHLLLGSVAEEVVAHAPCPVLTVRGGEGAEPLGAIDHVLAPVDLSAQARRSLLVARELAARYQADLEVIHVVEDVVFPSYFGQTIDVSAEIVARATAALDGFVEEAVGAAPVKRTVLMGQQASTEILRHAEARGSDLVVLSSHGQSELSEFLFGSTAKRVVQLSPVPVLVLKSFGKSLLADEG